VHKTILAKGQILQALNKIWVRGSPKEREVWPNPVSNELHIDNAANSAVTIYDMVGREVYRSFISSDKEVLRIGSLPQGVYVLHVVMWDGRVVVRRVVKG
jgi:hypothetical protein